MNISVKNLFRWSLVVVMVMSGLWFTTSAKASTEVLDPPPQTLCEASSVFDPQYWLTVQLLYTIRDAQGRLVTVVSCGSWNCSVQIRRVCDNKLVAVRKMTWPNMAQDIALPKGKYELTAVDILGSRFTPARAGVNLDRDRRVEFAASYPVGR